MLSTPASALKDGVINMILKQYIDIKPLTT